MNLSPDELERLVHGSLRELPGRRAPRKLESRVLEELQRRAWLPPAAGQSHPWWHESYAQWPAFVRGVFFVVSAGLAATLAAVLLELIRRAGSGELAASTSQRFASLTLAHNLWTLAWRTGGTVARSIPHQWIYGGLAFLAACYATVVGVGATAYRLFIQKMR